MSGIWMVHLIMWSDHLKTAKKFLKSQMFGFQVFGNHMVTLLLSQLLLIIAKKWTLKKMNEQSFLIQYLYLTNSLYNKYGLYVWPSK